MILNSDLLKNQSQAIVAIDLCLVSLGLRGYQCIINQYYSAIISFLVNLINQQPAMQYNLQPNTNHFQNAPTVTLNKASAFVHSHFHPSSSLRLIRIASPTKQGNTLKEDIKSTLPTTVNATPSPTIKPRQIRMEQPHCLPQSKSLLKPTKQINHNLSAINLTNPESSFNYPSRKATQQIRHITMAEQKKRSQWEGFARFLQNRRATKQNCKQFRKNFKETPSFIKKKGDVSKGVLQQAGIKVLKKLGEHRQLVRHGKSQCLLMMRWMSKKELCSDQQIRDRFKSYLKNSQINHSLLVKYFGYLSDKQNIYIFEEYTSGQALDKYIKRPEADFNQSVVGPLVCSLLTAVRYLRSIDQPYAKINSQSIIYSMNICKFKRQFLIDHDQNIAKSPKDILFDLWCIGKLAYELVTHSELISKDIMENISSIDQIFNSKEITKCIEVGFKRFQEIRISTEFIEFLIATLWTVQKKNLTLEAIVQLEFIKLYSDEDLWMQHREHPDNDKGY